MNNFLLKYLIITFQCALIASCSVVEPIKLPNDYANTGQQQQFKINFFPLTFKVAHELNLEDYPRLLSRPSNEFSANLVKATDISSGQFPPAIQKIPYRFGIGDVVRLTQYIQGSEVPPMQMSELNGTDTSLGATLSNPLLVSGGLPQNADANSSKVIATIGRVGDDGSLLLLGVGRVEAKGRQLSQIREEVRNILIQNGKDPNFQLEIEEFNSQKVYLTTDQSQDKTRSLVIPITDQALTLRELVSRAEIAFDQRVLTLLSLQRKGQVFSFSLSEVLAETSPDIYLMDADHVFIQNLEYVAGKVFLVGAVQPIVLPIKPEQRQTVADILFSRGGPMEELTAQRSAIYLLRGHNPIRAYHLDAQNPARILVADAVELRPNDIVFVGEQPISTFNRVLETILPLRIFSRDTKNGNLP